MWINWVASISSIFRYQKPFDELDFTLTAKQGKMKDELLVSRFYFLFDRELWTIRLIWFNGLDLM